MAKGSDFERQVAKQLGLWWTSGQRDDVFWRSQTSGARATQRAKQGKDTAGQFGDIAATDPIGAALVDVYSIELKRGYKDSSLQACLDRRPNHKDPTLAKHMAQAQLGCRQAGTLSWLLVTKRDGREVMCWQPLDTYRALRQLGSYKLIIMPFVQTRILVDGDRVSVVGMDWMAWLAHTNPQHVAELSDG